MKIDERIEKLSVKEMKALLCGLAKGPAEFAVEVSALETLDVKVEVKSDGVSPQGLLMVAYGLLKVLTDDRKCRSYWAGFEEAGEVMMSRPLVIRRLWSLFQSEEGQEHLKGQHRSVRFHRELLFEWFLGRYDLGNARWILVGSDRPWIQHLHGLLLLFMAVLAAIHLSLPRWSAPVGTLDRSWTVASTVAVYLAAVGAQVLSFSAERASRLERWIFAAQSLVPRLAAGSLVGLVALASSEELLSYVLDGASRWRLLLVLAAALAYLVLEIARRVHPMPRPRQLLRLAWNTFATALAHAIAIAVCAERALRSIVVPLQPTAMSCIQFANVAAFLLAIGLIVNLIWAEEPVTQPL